MQTFDVSVNVLNNNILSDKLLWKERNNCASSATRSVDKPDKLAKPDRPSNKVNKFTDKASVTEIAIVTVPNSESPLCSNWRPPNLRLEMILLMLAVTFVISFLIVFQLGTSKPMISTLLGCILVLATPAFMMLVHFKKIAVKNERNDVYVHILSLHAAGLFTILHQKALSSIFVVFVIIFLQLGWQTYFYSHTQNDIVSDFRTSRCKSFFYLFVAVVNSVTVATLVQYETQTQNNSIFYIDVLCVVVVLQSLIVYVGSNYI
jgi:hypothetical protein